MSKYFNLDSSGNLDLAFVNEEQKDMFYVKVIQPRSFWLYLQKNKNLQSLTVDINVVKTNMTDEKPFLSISTQNFPFLNSFRKTFSFFNIVVTCENYYV